MVPGSIIAQTIAYVTPEGYLLVRKQTILQENPSHVKYEMQVCDNSL